MVLFCSSAHQTEDWARHKKECKHLAKLGLWGCTYDEAKESANTLQPAAAAADADATTLFLYSEGTLLPELRPNPPECGICGRTEPLSLTPCCQNLICNRQHEYELFSYSREFCDRSHDRYTACGFHHGAGHAGDWRTCERCAADFNDDYWYSNNGYNFTPGPAPPKGSFHTAECDVCKGRVHRGFEGYSTYRGQVSCNDCTSAQGRYA
ncbi:hypothetical protein JKP88DRAFT_332136 [Tribonema minus]|uniref:MYND-type domain-containing protein n=1 Tax=Tribonema minus TaxID=303371 RepID=A0A835YVW1_9STRA|nr:hypothetical protein JKP88DRAFT_332136 [Tribonema minus]